jgi:murein L,D-transpeptidase YcbB/YkuD
MLKVGQLAAEPFMTTRHLRVLTGFVLFLLLSNGFRTESIIGASRKSKGTSSASNSGPQELSTDGEALLRGFLSAAQMPNLHWPSFKKYQKEAMEFYDAQSGTLPWINLGKPTTQAQSIIRVLNNAAGKGLRPEDYDSQQWDERLSEFEKSADVAESDLVKFDLALTVSAMRYVSDLHIGRVNPGLFHTALDVDNPPVDLSEFLRQKLVDAADVEAVLRTVEPPFPIYQRTEDALKKYMDFAHIDDGELLPVPSSPIKPGDSYAGILRLEKLLALFGDLPAEYGGVHGKGKYQGALVQAVKHFQERHGIEPNGFLDGPTLREMNTPLSHRVTQLQLSMERMRWLPHRFERPPIVVNIPEFRLYALNDEYRTVFTMNVVVGKSYGHQTPIFANVIRSVTFRPYWNVPESIVKAEMIPHIQKNPLYLSENSYEIVDQNENVVSEGAVNKEVEAQLRTGKLGIRQAPGPQNSLGLLKFEFPNEYDVYMHSTPAKQLFSKSRRDFSHGCIRVEDPLGLAKWVFQAMPEWTEESIQAAMNGEKTFSAKVKKPIPVLIFYTTAVVLEGEEPHFFEDIYGLDADLEEALARDVP